MVASFFYSIFVKMFTHDKLSTKYSTSGNK